MSFDRFKIDAPMGRLDDVRALIATEETDNVPIETYHSKLRTLAAEVDARDEVITKLLAILKPPVAPTQPCRFSDWCAASDQIKLLSPLYARACEIAGRTE